MTLSATAQHDKIIVSDTDRPDEVYIFRDFGRLNSEWWIDRLVAAINAGGKVLNAEKKQ